jgi:hypothetical protein
MLALLLLIGNLLLDPFKSRSRLVAENLFLRQQLNIALRRAPPRLRLCGYDRVLLVLMTWVWPSLLGMARVVQPGTYPAVASCRVQSLLALEVARPGGPAQDRPGAARSHPPNEQGKPVVGSPADPW